MSPGSNAAVQISRSGVGQSAIFLQRRFGSNLKLAAILSLHYSISFSSRVGAFSLCSFSYGEDCLIEMLNCSSGFRPRVETTKGVYAAMAQHTTHDLISPWVTIEVQLRV